MLLSGPLSATDPGTGTAVERVLMAFDRQYPLPGHSITLQFEDERFLLNVNADVDGYIHLFASARVFDDHDPHLLPGLLALIEQHTSGYMPMCGPRGANDYADYGWSDDFLEEQLLEQGHIKAFNRTSKKRLHELARKHGLNYEQRIEDEYGRRFFQVKYDPARTLASLGRLQRKREGHHPGTLFLILSDLQDLTRLPRPVINAKLETRVSCFPMVTLFNFQSEPHCGAWEAIDEYYQNFQQMGEEEPCFALSLDLTDLDETMQYLGNLLQASRAATALRHHLDLLESQLNQP